MTNPQGPPNDPSLWARPGTHDLIGRPAAPGAPTEQLRPDHAAPTEQLRPDEAAPTVASPAAQQAETPVESPTTAPADTTRSAPPPPRTRPANRRTTVFTPEKKPTPGKPKRRIHRDPLAIFLVLIIVVSLIIAGVIGAELYARHTANSKVAQVVACEVKDQATASFGVAPLLLWQLATKHFTNISVETAGNQIRDAKGMKIQIAIQNVRLKDTPTAKGTVGALDATITWTAEGIKESVQNAIPVLGPFVTNSVVTHPRDGTIELKGMLSNIIAKPVVSGNGLELQIINFNTLGFSLPREAVQSTLNDFTANLTKNYPLGIHADDVQVTPTGVVSHFSTRNASLPTGNGGQDPCFAHL